MKLFDFLWWLLGFGGDQTDPEQARRSEKSEQHHHPAETPEPDRKLNDLDFDDADFDEFEL